MWAPQYLSLTDNLRDRQIPEVHGVVIETGHVFLKAPGYNAKPQHIMSILQAQTITLSGIPIVLA